MCWQPGGNLQQAWQTWQIWQLPCCRTRKQSKAMRRSSFRICCIHFGHVSVSHTLQMTMWLQGGNTQQARRTWQTWQRRCSSDISCCVISSSTTVGGIQKILNYLLCFSTFIYHPSIIKQSCLLMSNYPVTYYIPRCYIVIKTDPVLLTTQHRRINEKFHSVIFHTNEILDSFEQYEKIQYSRCMHTEIRKPL